MHIRAGGGLRLMFVVKADGPDQPKRARVLRLYSSSVTFLR